MSKSTLHKVKILYNGTEEVFEPIMVENCMEPGTYKTYPVHINEDEDRIVVSSLGKSVEYVKNQYKIIITEEEFELQAPGKSKCDGNCDACRKCS